MGFWKCIFVWEWEVYYMVFRNFKRGRGFRDYSIEWRFWWRILQVRGIGTNEETLVTILSNFVLKTLGSFVDKREVSFRTLLQCMSHESYIFHHQTQGNFSEWDPTWQICKKLDDFGGLTSSFRLETECVTQVIQCVILIQCVAQELNCTGCNHRVHRAGCPVRRAGEKWTIFPWNSRFWLGWIFHSSTCIMIQKKNHWNPFIKISFWFFLFGKPTL